MTRSPTRRLALFIPTLECGGAERMMVNLLRGMVEAGITVDLLLARAVGSFLADVPSTVRLIDLKCDHLRATIWPLARYLRQERPHGVIARMTHVNLALLAARMLARTDTKIVIAEASNLSASMACRRLRPWIPALMRWSYPRADAIVAVSQGVARDLERQLGLPAGRVRVIYNPVVDPAMLARAQAPPGHPWLEQSQVPVFLTVGRLNLAKDHETLLRAFAIVRSRRPARLLILGEGEQRPRLEALRRDLRIEDDVALPGYCGNPYAAMQRASTFVLSSRFEGLPNAVIEALANGCPVVSTTCPSGPEEILEHGRYGHLVPIENAQALAEAMSASLDKAWDKDQLRRRGASFSVAEALPQYLDALDYPLPPALGRRAA